MQASSRTLKEALSELHSLQDKNKAKILQRFFKTGHGEYGEGDVFLGIPVPQIRALVKTHNHSLNLQDAFTALHSPFHEQRMFALLVAVELMKRANQKERRAILDAYLKNTFWINNWDLVDLTADRIVGPFIKDDKKILNRLVKSNLLWDRRIAMLSCFHWIKQGEPEPALKVAEKLLYDKHDLMHKAVGWMLREIGKRCSTESELKFLNKHAHEMPRTMLRYAIEHFAEKTRKSYLTIKRSKTSCNRKRPAKSR
ncbi:MAG: DNA alkylation repair protein [Patescibacteria group bacterium]